MARRTRESTQWQSVSGAGFAHLTQIDLSESVHSLRRECASECWGIALAEELRPQTALTGQQSKHALEDAHAKSKTQDTSIKHPPRTTTSTTTTTTAQETTQTKYNHIRDASGARIFLVTLYSSSLICYFQNTRIESPADDAPQVCCNQCCFDSYRSRRAKIVFIYEVSDLVTDAVPTFAVR